MPCPGIRHSMEVMDEGEPPAAATPLAYWKESRPPMKTPMKFTRSLPAKARAREKVPARTVRRRIFVMNKC